jgi:hypothetical protein
MMRKHFAEERNIKVLRAHEPEMKPGDLARKHDLALRTFSLDATIYSVGVSFQAVSMALVANCCI